MAKAKKRNPFAFDPIMKKGGLHQTSEKAQRKHHKQNLKKALIDSNDSAFFFVPHFCFASILFAAGQIALI